MKVLRAMMLASVCALTAAGSTSAPLLDVERTHTNVIIVETPTMRSVSVTEGSTTTTTTTTTLAEVIEMAPTTDALPAGAQDLPVDVVPAGALPSP